MNIGFIGLGKLGLPCPYCSRIKRTQSCRL